MKPLEILDKQWRTVRDEWGDPMDIEEPCAVGANMAIIAAKIDEIVAWIQKREAAHKKGHKREAHPLG